MRVGQSWHQVPENANSVALAWTRFSSTCNTSNRLVGDVGQNLIASRTDLGEFRMELSNQQLGRQPNNTGLLPKATGLQPKVASPQPLRGSNVYAWAPEFTFLAPNRDQVKKTGGMRGPRVQSGIPPSAAKGDPWAPPWPPKGPLGTSQGLEGPSFNRNRPKPPKEAQNGQKPRTRRKGT